MLPPAVVWVDPGGQTGIAALVQQPDGSRKFSAEESPFHRACASIDVVCEIYGPQLSLGYERFDINSETHKKTRSGTNDALHVIGVCRYLASKYSCRLLEPAAQHTPDKIEQQHLRALGWWVPGRDDAQSAACHMLRYLIRQNELTPAQRDVIYSR